MRVYNLGLRLNAIVHSLAKYGCQSQWTALIDDDEFILPKNGKTVLEILDSYKSYGGITMGWAWFGSNGHIEKPETLVIESYTKRQAKLDRLYKTIIQPKYFSWLKTIHYPMFPSSHPLVTEKFERVSTNWKRNHPTSDVIQLNHYKVKSMAEWIERVRVRGAVAGPHWRDTLGDFKTWDVNEVEDTDILRGLDTFDESKYNDSLALTEEEQMAEKEKKMEVLRAAIQLYKDRNPRLKKDHPQFVNWCIKRMYEYELIDEIELFEDLIECFPPHQYQTIGFINSLFPKPQPGLFIARDIIQIGTERRLKPSFKLYRNIVRVFGEKHEITQMTREWGWWWHVHEKRNPYPLQDGSYDYSALARDNKAMAMYVAERTMDQDCKVTEIKGLDGEVTGMSIVSRTQQDLAMLQIPDDTMRVTGPHSIWVGRVQRWYWVLRREERGDEFEGAPLSMYVTHRKEGKEGVQLWIEECRQGHKGIGNSTILFDEPDETLYINPEGTFVVPLILTFTTTVYCEHGTCHPKYVLLPVPV
eukprot:sb/3463791/